MIIAHVKNKSIGKAFVAGFFFGIFALIYYIFIRRELPKESILKCSGCGAEVTNSDKFCPDCGVRFQEQEINCPKCKTQIKSYVKFCPNCGYKLIEDKESEFICEFCDKNLKSEEALTKHYDNCEKKKIKDEKDIKTAILVVKVVGILVFLGLGIHFLINNKINLIPLFLIGFIVTPFFDKLFNNLKKRSKLFNNFEFNWWKKAIIVISILLVFILIMIFS